MTMMAGAFSRKRGRPLDPSWADSLRSALEPSPSEAVETAGGPDFLFLKKDMGILGGPAFLRSPDGSAAMLVGEPLLRPSRGGAGDRAADLAALAAGLAAGPTEVLGAATGAYALARFDAGRRELTLVSDKLGTRPLYAWHDEDTVVFATALKVLERLPGVPKVMNLRGASETVGFGFALADRTAYQGIRLLHAGERVRFGDRGEERDRYHRWDGLGVREGDRKALAAGAYGRFRDAVARRNGKDRCALAFLSGGLDSRCLVTVVKDLGVDLFTFNLAPEGTQDQYYGQRFAEALGSRHYNAPLPPATAPKYARMLRDAWEKLAPSAPARPERPRMAWSGDGGSVTVGHVYMDAKIAQLVRDGKRDEAVAYYLAKQKASLLPRLFPKDLYASLGDTLARGVREELEALRCQDPARGFHLFLMLNDQRRHLHAHFEEIDRHGMEFHLPFYDSDFVEYMVSLPLDWCLYHKFYSDWMKEFPPVVFSAPWQVYPGHDACPVPDDGAHLQKQWSAGGAFDFNDKPKLLGLAGEIQRTRPFPSILNRSYLFLVTWLYRLGIGDYAYAIEVAGKYHEYWRRTEGRYVLE